MARTDALAVRVWSGPSTDHWPASRPGRHDFPEAVTDLSMYTRFKAAVRVPILANITEFGQTPLYSREELGAAGGRSRAVLLLSLPRHECRGVAHLRNHPPHRSQAEALPLMQTRDELYRFLDYHAYEEKLDACLRPASNSRMSAEAAGGGA